jgi:serine/threonine protein kinase
MSYYCQDTPCTTDVVALIHPRGHDLTQHPGSSPNHPPTHPPARACADFGLSTALKGSATHVSNYGAGTPFYLAPEVAQERRVTRGSDVYSFGAMAWQVMGCLTSLMLPPDIWLHQ